MQQGSQEMLKVHVCVSWQTTRTNRIIIKGDTATRKRIRQMIEMLDVPAADRLGGLKVFRLKYASAQNLAEILQGLVSGQAVSSGNTFEYIFFREQLAGTSMQYIGQ